MQHAHMAFPSPATVGCSQGSLIVVGDCLDIWPKPSCLDFLVNRVSALYYVASHEKATKVWHRHERHRTWHCVTLCHGQGLQQYVGAVALV